MLYIIHIMMTSSNGNIFHVTGLLWWKPPVTDGFTSQRPVTRRLEFFFDLRLNKRWSKQSRRRWWFETPSCSLWRHCNVRNWSSLCLSHYLPVMAIFNTLRPRQNGRHFPDDIFKCIFLNENGRISIKISLKFVPKVPITNIPALVPIMAWRRPGAKPLSEPMMVRWPTHICVIRPQWIKHNPDYTFWASVASNGFEFVFPDHTKLLRMFRRTSQDIASIDQSDKFHNAHHFPQCTIQNRNVHIYVLTGVLWYMVQVHCGVCEIGPFEHSWSILLYGVVMRFVV